MENVRGHIKIGNKNYTWIGGDELVRKVGDDLVEEEINGSGYSAQLKRFIAERDKRLAEENAAKVQRRDNRMKKVKAPEPGDE